MADDPPDKSPDSKYASLTFSGQFPSDREQAVPKLPTPLFSDER